MRKWSTAQAVKRVTHPDDEVRNEAFDVLLARGDAQHLPLAVAALDDPDAIVVATAVQCIVEWEGKRVANRIAPLAEHPDALVRYHAAWALGRLGAKRYLPLLRKRFRVARRALEGITVAESLYRLTRRRAYLDHLLERLRGGDAEDRASATNSLAGVVDAKNFAEIVSALAHALEKERNVVAKASLRRDLELAVANALDATE